MAVQTMWMRENMFGPVGQFNERRINEDELKIQRSLQKSSTPHWFLDQLTPSKVIKNFIPSKSRTSAWKNSNSYKYPDCKKTINDAEEKSEYGQNSDDSGTFDTAEDDDATTENIKEHEATLNTKSEENKKELNTDIPIVNLKNVSETYPRISPSRKIQNINLVFSRTPKRDCIKLSKELLQKNDPLENVKSFSMNQRDPEQETTKNPPGPPENNRTFTLKSSKMLKNDLPNLKSPDRTGSFKIRAFSTPDGSPVSLFSSTLMDEDSLNSSRRSSLGSSHFQLNYVDRKKQKIYPLDVNMTKRKLQTLKYLLSRRDELLRCKKESATNARRSLNDNITTTFSICSSEDNDRSDSDQSESACNNLLNSRRKSTELEKIVKSGQTSRADKGFVRGIVDELNRKQKSSSTKLTRQVPDLNQTYVKMAVDAFENGNASKARQILVEKGRIKDDDTEIESSSDSDLKSDIFSMSFSIRDSDSNSSSDLESTTSPMFRSNHERQFSYNVEDIQEITANDSKKKKKEDVHWIPVLFCKICPSTWGKTYTKVRRPSSKLFPIDETTVTDSGYSEVYDMCSATFTN